MGHNNYTTFEVQLTRVKTGTMRPRVMRKIVVFMMLGSVSWNETLAPSCLLYNIMYNNHEFALTVLLLVFQGFVN